MTTENKYIMVQAAVRCVKTAVMLLEQAGSNDKALALCGSLAPIEDELMNLRLLRDGENLQQALAERT